MSVHADRPATTDATAPSETTASKQRRGLWLWLRIVGLVVGLALAAYAIRLQAQLWESPGDIRPLWTLLVVGAVFAILTDGIFGPRSITAPPIEPQTTPAPLPAGSASDEAPARAGARAWLPVAVRLALALLAEAGCLLIFQYGWQFNLAWVLHLIACGAFLSALRHWPGPSAGPFLPGWSRLDTVLLATVLLLALVARLWRVSSVPEGIWFDEADRGIQALKVMSVGQLPPFLEAAFMEPVGIRSTMIPLIALLGRDTLALRLPVVLLGTLGVGTIYLLARYLYGWRTAVVAAGLAIGFVWHLNFSRIALPAIPSLTWDTLGIALLVVALRSGNRVVYGAAGIAAAGGLYWYFSSQFMPIILALIVLHQLVTRRLTFLRQHFLGLVCLGIGFLIASGPVIQTAVAEYGRFTSRANTVSIFNEVQAAGNWSPLITNVQNHLLMFGVRGDPNGRHNWSGHPMLDPVTGGLAVAGLALALLRPWRLERAVPLLWLPVGMAGGVLSLSFEAPQSHRAIDALLPPLLFAALPIGLLWGELDRLVGELLTHRPTWGRVDPFASLEADFGRPPLGSLARGSLTGRSPAGIGYALTAVLVILALGATNVMNIGRYFGQQQTEARTWSEMNGGQALAARQIVALPAPMTVYLDPSWMVHPAIRFLDGRSHQYLPFDPAANMPVTDETAAIFIGERPAIAEQLTALYPTAQRTVFQVPDGRSVGGYGFVLTPEVLGLHRGVAAHYQGPAGVVDRQEPTLDLGWPSGLPLPAPFDATFTATLTVPSFGQYQLALEGPPSLTLTLDGVDVLTGGKSGVLPLARGNHVLRLVGTGLGAEPVRLLWATQPAAPQPIESRFLNVAPVQTTGLLARLYAGEAPSGEPRIQQVDPNVNLQVHLLPLPRPYTVEWSGSIRAEKDGFYRFGVGDVGVFSLWIDDVLLGETVGNGFANGEVDLAPGWHDIKIRFIDRGSFASVTAYWQQPGRTHEIIPTTVLRPWPSTRVAAARPEDGDLPAAGGQTAGDNAPRLTPTASTARPVRAAPLGEVGEVRGVGALSRMRGIAAGPDGAVYVVESGQKTIVRIAPDGSTSRIGEGELTDPSAVAVLPDGGVVVLDAGAGTLVRFDGDGGSSTRLFADQGFYGPRGLSATADGRLIVSDTGKNRLMVGSPDGSSVSVNDVAQPTGATLLRDGTLLVAETGAERIVQVNTSGIRIASWTMPTSSTSPGPQAVALPDGGWAVTAPEAQAIIVRRGEDGPVEIRSLGDAARRPSGLLIDRDGRLVVADAETGRLRIFNLP